jgi:hypothetical protein
MTKSRLKMISINQIKRPKPKRFNLTKTSTKSSIQVQNNQFHKYSIGRGQSSSLCEIDLGILVGLKISMSQ